jgi:hypothetical protein
MKHSRNRYQHGSVRKVPRANGFAWEFRFYCSDENGERKLKTQTFDALEYPTETAVLKAIEPQLGALDSDTLSGKISATMKTIIDRYYAEEFPSLRHSTQSTNRSLIDLHLRPNFGEVRPSVVSAILAAQKARARNILSRLLDLANRGREVAPGSLVPISRTECRRRDSSARFICYNLDHGTWTDVPGLHVARSSIDGKFSCCPCYPFIPEKGRCRGKGGSGRKIGCSGRQHFLRLSACRRKKLGT